MSFRAPALRRDACRPSARSRRGFTIVEFLVSAAVVALMVVLTLPAISKARLVAQQSQGQAQMSNVGKAVFTYASDHNGYCPTQAGLRHREYTSSYWALYQQTRGVPGHTIWVADTANASLPSADAVGAVGLGVLVTEGYLNSATEFFHPVMRTYWDISGGSSKHWWNVQRNFGKFQPDPTIVPALPNFPNSVINVNSGSNWTNPEYTAASGSFINCNMTYRNGSWLKFDGAKIAGVPISLTPTDLTSWGGQPHNGDSITNNMVDAIDFNRRVVVMNTPYENQFNRQGGQLDYLMGDGSVGVTRSLAFKGDKPLGSNATVPIINTPGEAPVPPNGNATCNMSLWQNGGALDGVWCYIVEHDLGIW
ncbi:MAG: hypothetical protein NTW19_16025 [Planctomycetota bacterium]|nr:hypothetical protein [Planctomycetota bacterium]